MTFASALALTRAAYAVGRSGGDDTTGANAHDPRTHGPWWEAAEALGLRHRSRYDLTTDHQEAPR